MKVGAAAAVLVTMLVWLSIPTPASAQNNLIVPGQGVGEIRFGMSAADVYRILGDPNRSFDGERGARTYYWEDRGIWVQISDPGVAQAGDPGGVTSITVIGKQWATREGFAVGASELRLQALLPKPTSVTYPKRGAPPLALYKYREL